MIGYRPFLEFVASDYSATIIPDSRLQKRKPNCTLKKIGICREVYNGN